MLAEGPSGLADEADRGSAFASPVPAAAGRARAQGAGRGAHGSAGVRSRSLSRPPASRGEGAGQRFPLRTRQSQLWE